MLASAVGGGRARNDTFLFAISDNDKSGNAALNHTSEVYLAPHRVCFWFLTTASLAEHKHSNDENMVRTKTRKSNKYRFYIFAFQEKACHDLIQIWSTFFCESQHKCNSFSIRVLEACGHPRECSFAPLGVFLSLRAHWSHKLFLYLFYFELSQVF